MKGELFVGIKKERNFWSNFYGGIRRSYIYKFGRKKAVGWYYKRNNMLNYRIFYLLKFKKLFFKRAKVYQYKRLKFIVNKKEKRRRRRKIKKLLKFDYFLLNLKSKYLRRKYKKKFKLRYKFKLSFLYSRLFKHGKIGKKLKWRLKKRRLKFFRREDKLWRVSYWAKRIKTGLWVELKITNKRYRNKYAYFKKRKKNRELTCEIRKSKAAERLNKKRVRVLVERDKVLVEKDELLLELKKLLLKKKNLLLKESLLLKKKKSSLLIKKKLLDKVGLVLKVEEILDKKEEILLKKKDRLVIEQAMSKTVAKQIKRGVVKIWFKLLNKLREMRFKRLLLKRRAKLKRRLKRLYSVYVRKFYKVKNVKSFTYYLKVIKKLNLKKNLKFKLIKNRTKFYKKKGRFRKFISRKLITLMKRGHKYTFLNIRDALQRKYTYLPYNSIIKIAAKEYQYYSRIGEVDKGMAKVKAKFLAKIRAKVEVLTKAKVVKAKGTLVEQIRKKVKCGLKFRGKIKFRRKIKFENKLVRSLRLMKLIKPIKRKKKKLVIIVKSIIGGIAKNSKKLTHKTELKIIKKEGEKDKRIGKKHIVEDSVLINQIKRQEGLKKCRPKELKGLEFTSNWFYKLFSGCFAKKGHRTRAEYMFGRVLLGVRLKLKSKRFDELKWLIFRKFTKIRPLTGIRLKVIAGITYRFPRKATLKSEYAMVLHWFVESVLKRKEYNLYKKLINEFVDVFKYKGGTIRKRFEFNWTILDSRPFATFLRNKKKRKRT